jgi:hypothetical protein
MSSTVKLLVNGDPILLRRAGTLGVVVALASLVGCVQQRPRGASPRASRESAGVSWWFPAELGVGTQQHFRVDHKSTIVYRGKERHVDEQADIVLEVAAPEADEPGYILRMLPPPPELDPAAGITALAICLLANHSPEGIRVTRDAVLAYDMPLFRGPWRKGDQFSVFGFGLFVFLIANDYLFGVMHFDVESATPTGAHLTCEFWAGKQKPILSGRGELTLESDAQGLTRVHSYWERTYGPEWREATVTITRVGIREPGVE